MMYMYHCLIFYFFEGNMDCFQFSTITNKTAMYIYVPAFVWT